MVSSAPSSVPNVFCDYFAKTDFPAFHYRLLVAINLRGKHLIISRPCNFHNRAIWASMEMPINLEMPAKRAHQHRTTPKNIRSVKLPPLKPYLAFVLLKAEFCLFQRSYANQLSSTSAIMPPNASAALACGEESIRLLHAVIIPFIVLLDIRVVLKQF